MSLRIPVMMREINNLSAARYGAGMGAEWLCFTAGKDMPLEKIESITGWVSGVKYVCEFPSVENFENEEEYVEAPFDFFLTDSFLPKSLEKHILKIAMQENTIEPVLDALPKLESRQMVLIEGLSDQFIFENKKIITEWNKKCKLIIGSGISIETLPVLLDEIKPHAISISAPSELKPGMLNQHISMEILDLLST